MLIYAAGSVDSPATVDFLTAVASTPLPAQPAATSTLETNGAAKREPCAASGYENEMVVRMTSLFVLGKLISGPHGGAARHALVELVRKAERPIRREAAVTLLLAATPGEKQSVIAELRPLIPEPDNDVFTIQRRVAPDPINEADLRPSTKKRRRSQLSAPPTIGN
jgi:hypothetical protein